MECDASYFEPEESVISTRRTEQLLYNEDGGSTFVRKIGTYQRKHITSHPR